MTHGALAHLELPLWLDEGIAVTTEHQISVSNRHPRDAVERIGRHLEFWNAERIQEFWTGKSFSRTDDGDELSYDLARASWSCSAGSGRHSWNSQPTPVAMMAARQRRREF